LEAVWQDVSGLSNTRIVVSSEEIRRIEEAIEGVLAPFVRRDPSDAPAGARGVLLLRYVMPEGVEHE
jgi:hypothetical protein